MKKKMKAVFVIGAALLLSVTGVYAFREVTTEYQMATGKVDIHLEDITLVNGKEESWTENELVMPGMNISRIARICNDASNCYVRAKVIFDSKWEVENPITEEYLTGINDTWVKRGEYYYYKDVLKDHVDLFQGIHIPDEWDTVYDENGDITEYYTQNQWDLMVEVDAIQSKNFTPDFSSSTPWGIEGKDYVIEAAKEGQLTVYEATEKRFLIQFAPDTADLVTDTQNFKEDLELFMPGDTQIRCLNLHNQTKKSKNLYFRSESSDDEKLLDKMQMKIILHQKSGDSTVYQGNMKAVELEKVRKLCTVKSDEEKQLEFQFSMPKELRNTYSLREGAIKFYFSTDPAVIRTHPKTGDAICYIPLVLFVISCVLITASICKMHREKRNG